MAASTDARKHQEIPRQPGKTALAQWQRGAILFAD
jgi:hypothetical protein